MKEIHRVIASALIFSKDNKLLMGKKDPNAGGVYPDCRHIPGGGTDLGESLKDTVIREVKEETGLDISECDMTLLPHKSSGTSKKILKDIGEEVLCHMEFNRFKIVLDKKSTEIICNVTGDLVEIRWFDLEELSTIKHVPGGKEFLQKMGYIN